jgi:hypothetical protein
MAFAIKKALKSSVPSNDVKEQEHFLTEGGP